jgi:RNA polymerase sigma-70 factor, ECF subfamily
MSNPLTERLWVYRIRSGRDQKSFAAVYDRYLAQIYRFVFFKIGSEEDAKEISTDVFMRAWEHISGGKDVSDLTGLLYMIARSAVVDHLRKKKLEFVSLESAAETADDRMNTSLSSELSETLAAIKLLKEEYREALLMRHVDGLNVGEIGRALGKNNGTTRVLLHRATEALKEIMK